MCVATINTLLHSCSPYPSLGISAATGTYVTKQHKEEIHAGVSAMKMIFTETCCIVLLFVLYGPRQKQQQKLYQSKIEKVVSRLTTRFTVMQ